MNKQTAEIIVRHLLGIAAALQKEYNIPVKSQPIPTSVTLPPADSHIIGVTGYEPKTETKTE